MPEKTEDSRFVYYTRFYRRAAGGDFPESYTISLYPAGAITILTLPGDNDTWSTTLYATTSDKAMRAVRDPQVFEQVVRAHPLRASWVDGEALTGVEVMAGISDRERSLFLGELPIATGVVSVADAWACTNPSLGRGITMALIHASSIVNEVTAFLDDPEELANAWRRTTSNEVQPWHTATLEKDRRRNAEMDAIRLGEASPDHIPSVLFDGANPDEAAFFAAMGIDQDVFRAGLEMAGLYVLPEIVMARPAVREKLGLMKKAVPQFPPPPIPDRSQLEALLA